MNILNLFFNEYNIVANTPIPKYEFQTNKSYLLISTIEDLAGEILNFERKCNMNSMFFYQNPHIFQEKYAEVTLESLLKRFRFIDSLKQINIEFLKDLDLKVAKLDGFELLITQLMVYAISEDDRVYITNMDAITNFSRYQYFQLIKKLITLFPKLKVIGDNYGAIIYLNKFWEVHKFSIYDIDSLNFNNFEDFNKFYLGHFSSNNEIFDNRLP
ncbi:MAG: hypothetical protein MUE85_21390 [Microscillaceae bacterium]|jgi:hypothetical protein|nr:hypothetical protein [Microscillaceae bacterium]